MFWASKARRKNKRERDLGQIKIPEDGPDLGEIRPFRNVHYAEPKQSIGSINEAEKILKETPNDLGAFRY